MRPKSGRLFWTLNLDVYFIFPKLRPKFWTLNLGTYFERLFHDTPIISYKCNTDFKKLSCTKPTYGWKKGGLYTKYSSNSSHSHYLRLFGGCHLDDLLVPTREGRINFGWIQPPKRVTCVFAKTRLTTLSHMFCHTFVVS